MTANRKYNTEPECSDVECAYDFSLVELAVMYVYSTWRSALADVADTVFVTLRRGLDWFMFSFSVMYLYSWVLMTRGLAFLKVSYSYRHSLVYMAL
jgi:hypothetical protein